MDPAEGAYRVHAFPLPSGQAAVTVLGPEGVVLPIERLLRSLVALRYSPHTCRGYASDLAQWFNFLHARQLSWDQVSVKVIPDWIFHLRYGNQVAPERRIIPLHPEEHLQAKTVNRKLSALYRFYQYHDHTQIAADLTRWLKSGGTRRQRFWKPPFHLREPKRRVSSLTAKQLQTVIDACETSGEAFLIGLLGQRGLRIGQALGLRHQDISVRELTYTIVPRDDNLNGARAKTRDTSVLPLTKPLARLYTRYLVDEYGTLDCDYVFVNFSGPHRHEPMRYDDANFLAGKLRRRTGVQFTLHTLRHTFATLEAARGTPIQAVQMMLCHRDPATTSSTYFHLTTDYLRDLLGDVSRGAEA